MNHSATRRLSGTLCGLAALLGAGGVFALAGGASATAAGSVSAPTLSVSFTPAEIGVGESSGITYTITDPNPSGSLTNVGFSDTLPSFATVDNPTGASASGCGTPTIGAGAGNGVDGVAGITVKAGTPCTISISIFGDSAGSGADTLGPLSYSPSAGAAVQQAPSANETPATLQVIAAPTATVSLPHDHAVIPFGATVHAHYSCSAPSDANGTTLAGCLASDDLGNTIADGGALDTRVPGVHTLDVQALETNGDTTDTTVTYRVLPDNVVTVVHVRALSGDRALLDLKVPGPGTLTLRETHGRVTLVHLVRTVSAARALALSLVPTPGARAAVGHGRVSALLTLSFTPRGGRPASQRLHLSLR